jgi:hypothetical protein
MGCVDSVYYVLCYRRHGVMLAKPDGVGYGRVLPLLSA